MTQASSPEPSCVLPVSQQPVGLGRRAPVNAKAADPGGSVSGKGIGPAAEAPIGTRECGGCGRSLVKHRSLELWRCTNGLCARFDAWRFMKREDACGIEP